MFRKSKSCPRCAEKVRELAQVCRYCGHEFPQSAGIETEGATNGVLAAVLVAVVALGGTGWLTYSVWSDLQHTRATNTNSDNITSLVEVPDQGEPKYEEIALGMTLEWAAESSPDEIQRQAGPYVLTITKRQDDDLVAPVIKLAAGSESITLEGELASDVYVNRISLIANRSGAVPVVMLQSFTGGAHCCNHVQLAGFSRGKLKVVDLGLWDGDEVSSPRDVSGDGLADFVMVDNSFLYAFASYAESFAPPKILNVVAGRVNDVSRNPAFKRLFAQEMVRAGASCQPEAEHSPNGACASYVAAAARIGKLDQAWARMLVAYDASSDWDLPTGCLVSDEGGCPNGSEIVYKSYPEALQAFLRRNGYIPKSWVPPELRQTQAREPEPPSHAEYTT